MVNDAKESEGKMLKIEKSKKLEMIGRGGACRDKGLRGKKV